MTFLALSTLIKFLIYLRSNLLIVGKVLTLSYSFYPSFKKKIHELVNIRIFEELCPELTLLLRIAIHELTLH